MIAALSSIGCTTVVVDPEAGCHEPGNDSWLQGFDVVVARGRSWSVLSLLSWAEARGVPTLNTRAAIARVHNKADMAVALKMAGIPTPVTRFGSPRELARRLPRPNFPLILKPVFGDNGNGLRVVQDAAELESMPWPDSVVLAQKFEPSSCTALEKRYGWCGNLPHRSARERRTAWPRESRLLLSFAVSRATAASSLGLNCMEWIALRHQPVWW